MKSQNRIAQMILGGWFALYLASTIVPEAAAQTWTQLFPSGGPPPARVGQSAVLDSAANRMIVFGGTLFNGVPGPAGLLNDVWVLANADGLGGTPTWAQLSPSGTPPTRRYGSAAVYDPATSRMIMYGGDPNAGSCFGAANDVWVLSLGGTPAWAQLSPVGGPPQLRQNPTAVYDSANNRMIVYGGNNNACVPFNSGEVWVLSNANGLGGTPTWTQLSIAAGPSPAPRVGNNSAYDAATNRMIVFGGGTAAGNVNDLWVLSNANGLGGTPAWTQLSPTGGPPSARVFSTAVYDPNINRMTLFGGVSNVELNDVWVLTNANGLAGTPTWMQLSPTGGPPAARDEHTAVLNLASNRMNVYAGRGCGSAGCQLGDTWVLTDANGFVFFSAFNAKVEIALGPFANDDKFDVNATFSLGAESDGINPLTEDVSLKVGAFSTTIPAGSFIFHPAKPKKPAQFTFEGVVAGVALEAKIIPVGANTFQFKAEGKGAELTGTVNPVTLGLTIGNDSGSASVTAEF